MVVVDKVKVRIMEARRVDIWLAGLYASVGTISADLYQGSLQSQIKDRLLGFILKDP